MTIRDSHGFHGFVSFVIPAKDEEATLETLYSRIAEHVSLIGAAKFEVIFIDDGSKDATWSVMRQLAASHSDHVRAFRLRRNFGKALALALGFGQVRGDLVFTMDADLQDDPAEIPAFLTKLEEGYDVVSGWKEKRNDPRSKTLPSKLFNRVTAWMSGLNLRDFNCGFKLYRREVVQSIRLYGELHRYVPVLAHDLGFRVGEIAVKHHPREHGVSKYGFERYARGLLDLMAVLVTTRYLQKPGHLFGGIGLLFGLVGGIALAYLGFVWMFGDEPIGNRPLLIIGVLFVILSIQLLSLGLLAELINRHAATRSTAELVVEQAPVHEPDSVTASTDRAISSVRMA